MFSANLISILILIIGLSNNSKAQANQCRIDSYLTPVITKTTMTALYETGGPFKKGFTKMPGFKKDFKVSGIDYEFLVERYILNNKTFIDIGKTNIRNNPIYFFGTENGRKQTFFIEKTPCSIELAGYKIYNVHEIDLNFNLTSSHCNMNFSVEITKTNVFLNQYDYIR